MSMQSATLADTGIVDLEYVAVCIAEQVVRIKLSASRRQRANEQANDTSRMLATPLLALAASLGVRDRVTTLVADALPGAMF